MRVCCRIVLFCCVLLMLAGCIRYARYGTDFDVTGTACDARTGQPLPDVEVVFVVASSADSDRSPLGKSDGEGVFSGSVRYRWCEKDVVVGGALPSRKCHRTFSVELSLPGYATQSFTVDEDTLPHPNGKAVLDLGTVKLEPEMDG